MPQALLNFLKAQHPATLREFSITKQQTQINEWEGTNFYNSSAWPTYFLLRHPGSFFMGGDEVYFWYISALKYQKENGFMARGTHL